MGTDIRFADALRLLPIDRRCGVPVIAAAAIGGIRMPLHHAQPCPALVATQWHADARIALPLPAIARAVAAGGDAGLVAARRSCAFQNNIDHAGDGIGAVLGRGAVAQHFDMVDGRHGNRIEISWRGTTTQRTLKIQQGAGVPALAIDQHEGFIGREPAQRGRPHDARTVVTGCTGKVKRGHEARQDGPQLGIAR